jgi:hypothetical protein
MVKVDLWLVRPVAPQQMVAALLHPINSYPVRVP